MRGLEAFGDGVVGREREVETFGVRAAEEGFCVVGGFLGYHCGSVVVGGGG